MHASQQLDPRSALDVTRTGGGLWNPESMFEVMHSRRVRCAVIDVALVHRGRSHWIGPN